MSGSGRLRALYRRLPVALAMVCASVLPSLSPVPAPPVAHAVTVTWDGGATNDARWSAAANWSNNQAPAFVDVVFDSTSTKANMMDRTFDLNSLTINSGYPGTFSSEAGAILFLQNGLIMSRDTFVTLPMEMVLRANQVWQTTVPTGILILNGPVTLPGQLEVRSTGTVNFASSVTGAASSSLVKTGSGGLVLSGTAGNSYGGGTFVRLGVLQLDKTGVEALPPGLLEVGDPTGQAGVTLRIVQPNQIPDTTRVQLGALGRFDLNGQNETVASVDGDGYVTLGSGTLTVGTNGASGALLGPITGAGGLTKNGSGSYRLYSADNAYTGPTTLNAGGLVLTGTLPGPVFVGNGTLAGTASVGAISSAIGTIAPGDPFVTNGMSAAGLDLGQDATLAFRINSNAANAFTRINVSGAVKLDRTTLSVTTGGVIPPNSHFAIVTKSSSGAVNGTFANLPEGTAFVAPGPGGGTVFRISYVGGTGNDIVLTALGPACSPRPRVQVTSRAVGGKLETTITPASLNFGVANSMVEFRLDRLDNATIVVNGRDDVTVGHPIGFQPNTRSTTMVTSRVTPGQASTVRFTVTDTCGSWQSFVGGGPSAF